MVSTKRILLAGNELRVTQIVRLAFEEIGGYVIEEERNWQTALQTAQQFHPNIIFFDLGFDALGWSETIQQIKTNAVFANTPIFMLTLSQNGDSIVYRGSLNGYEFSISPVKIEELVRSIDEMLAA